MRFLQHWSRPTTFLGAMILTVCLLAAPAAAQPPAPDLGYAQEVSWQVDELPEIGALEGTIRSTLRHVFVGYTGVDGDPIEGFFPGANYQYFGIPTKPPFYLYARDTATIQPMARFYYSLRTLRSPIEEHLRLQYPDGAISATIDPWGTTDKATVVSDEETSAIVGAWDAYRVVPDPAWLETDLRGQPLIDRLNRAMAWVLTARWDAATGLIKRAHTTDWGDVKWEVAENRTDMAPGDQWTASIYDQAIAYAALQGLVQMNTASGREVEAQRWQDEAERLRAAVNQWLWQPERGYYRMHVHLEPNQIHHPYDEGEIIAIGNAAAIYYGLAEPEKVPSLVAALEWARLDSGAYKPGLTLHPAYTDWPSILMAWRLYQNGALWDWWAGRQITAEFKAGHSALAAEHLILLARDWATHPGIIREWESPWLDRVGIDGHYAGASATVGQAVVEGLFGVDFYGQEVRLTPRLGNRNGYVRVYQPATDLYAAYRYEPGPDVVRISYGTNSPAALSLRIPLLWGDAPVEARLNDRSTLDVWFERVGEDAYAVMPVPSGIHTVELLRLDPIVEAENPAS